ncbi:MAG: glutamate--tRNA ligase [Pseudomonadota bacterium]
MPETVRFAPSPTGELHIGNIRTALYNSFLAMRTGGSFVLRYDDTDVERSREAFANQIAADLDWLGITIDRVERQSARLAAYDEVAQKLRGEGLLYPCYETPEELDRKRSRQRARGLPPVYDRAGLALSEEDRARLETEGRRPHWRFKLPGGARAFDDLCRGPQTVNLGAVSDPILVREDGSYLYTLPSVVDDMAFGVTTVVRGEDHVTNTGVQIALFEALGAEPPVFAHHNLLTRSDGEPLSKRDNPLSIRALAAEGYEPMAIASLATLVGTSHPVAPLADLSALAATVALSDVSRGPAMFDPAELTRLNAALVHDLPVSAVAALLPQGLSDPERFWDTIKGNLTFRREAQSWAERLMASPSALRELAGEGAWSADDRAFLGGAADVLEALSWGEDAFSRWTGAVKSSSGRKGKALFMPLRRALTGSESGPELGPWLQVLGRDAAVERLRAIASG